MNWHYYFLWAKLGCGSLCLYLDVCFLGPFTQRLLPHVHMCLASWLALCRFSSGLCRHISLSLVRRLCLTGPGRQQKTGAEHAWLADGSADLLSVWEGTGAGGLFCTAAPWPHPSFGGSGLLGIYLTVSLSHLLGITFSHCLLGHVFLTSLLSRSSLFPPVLASLWLSWPELKRRFLVHSWPVWISLSFLL